MKTTYKIYQRNGFWFFEMKGTAGKLTFGVSKSGLVLKNLDSIVEAYEEYKKDPNPESFFEYELSVFRGNDKEEGTLIITRIALEYILDCRKDLEKFYEKYHERPANKAITEISVKKTEGLQNKEWILLPCYEPRPGKDETSGVEGELCPMYLTRKKIDVLLKAKNILAMQAALEDHLEEVKIKYLSGDNEYEYTLKPEEMTAILKNQHKLALYGE